MPSNLDKDPRERRVDEITAAARRYVRDCASTGMVIDIERWGQRRWRRDGDRKRRAMIDALADEIENGAAVVDIWRRFELQGGIARQLIAARSYGDLYRRLRDHGLEPGFRPAEIARWARDGRISKARLGEIFGLTGEDIDPFIRSWVAYDASHSFKQATAGLAGEGTRLVGEAPDEGPSED